MKDNELIAAIRAAIIAGEPIVGLKGIDVVQAYQPTQQGVARQPTIYLFKIGDHRYGSLGRTDIWDEPDSEEIHTETQYYLTTFQISALATQDPSDLAKPTASDIVNGVAAIMQNSTTIQNLQDQDIGLLRVADVRNPYFIDDRGRFEASPSFDIDVVHKQIVTTEIPVLQSEELQIIAV